MRGLGLECRFHVTSRTVDYASGARRFGGTSSMSKKVRSGVISASWSEPAGQSVVERRVLKLIESGVPCSIGRLATQLHLSPSHLQRLFKHETGLRMGEWLITFRLQKAAYLLANSYLSVKEIARAAGYEHVSSFIRAFERKYVLTPTRFRERADADVDKDD